MLRVFSGFVFCSRRRSVTKFALRRKTIKSYSAASSSQLNVCQLAIHYFCVFRAGTAIYRAQTDLISLLVLFLLGLQPDPKSLRLRRFKQGGHSPGIN